MTRHRKRVHTPAPARSTGSTGSTTIAVLAAADGHPGPRIDFARSVLRWVPPARLASADAARWHRP